jgi:hypothetical protein
LKDGLLLSTAYVMTSPRRKLPKQSTVLIDKEEGTPEVKKLTKPTSYPELKAVAGKEMNNNKKYNVNNGNFTAFQKQKIPGKTLSVIEFDRSGRWT